MKTILVGAHPEDFINVVNADVEKGVLVFDKKRLIGIVGRLNGEYFIIHISGSLGSKYHTLSALITQNKNLIFKQD